MEWKDMKPGKQYLFTSRIKDFDHADGEVQYVGPDPDDGATAIVRRWDDDGNDQVYFQVERHELSEIAHPQPSETTVAELIKFLQKQPQDLLVAHDMFSEHCLLDLSRVEIKKACEPREDDWVARERPDMPTRQYLMFPG